MKNVKRIVSIVTLTLLFEAMSAYAAETTVSLNTEGAGLYISYGLTDVGDGILIADYQNNRVLKKTDTNVTVVAGKSSQIGGYVDGDAEHSLFNGISDVAVNSKGEIFIADSENNGIRKIDKSDKVITWSGSYTAGYANGSRQDTKYNQPMGIAIDSEDNIYVADTLNHVIRKINTNGVSSTLAGTGKAGYVNGDLDSASFNEPTDVAVDKNGVIYVADSGNQCIRKIQGGNVTTIAGTPTIKDEATGYYTGGYVNGFSAQFNFPRSITLLNNGEILVADTLNNAIRKVKTNGEVITVYDSANGGIDEPVAVLYKNGKYYISQRWRADLKIINEGMINNVK